MDIKRIALIEKENKSFIRYSLAPEETVSKIELEMLKNNRIQGVLELSEIQDDNGIVFLYNVTSKIQLLQRFTMPFSGEQVYKMLQSLCRLWMCTDEYMLDRKHFMAYPELMCIDQDTSELYVMVLPIYTDDKEIEFRKIVVGILNSLSYTDTAMPNFPLLLMEYIQDHIQLITRDFFDFLEKIYQAQQGILQPINEAPDIPEHEKEDRKEIVHEEDAKEILRSRFQAQNDEVKLLNSSLKKEEGKNPFMVATNVTIPIKEKRTEKIMPFGIPPAQGKKEEKKPKVKKEKKIKEKKDKKKETVSTIVQAVPEKEEKPKKEKKGWFHGFGFGKKKEVMEEKQLEKPEVLVPRTEINEKRVTITEKDMNELQQNEVKIENRAPVGKDMNAWQGMPHKTSNNNYQSYSTWSLYGEVQKDLNNQQQEYGEGNLEKSQEQQPQQEIPLKRIVPTKDIMMSLKLPVQEKELDLDATVLLDGSMDLDATMLMDSEKGRETTIPVLRSRETGELIKITHNGFLVGRQKMRNGKVINLLGTRQPDLILAVNNISHSHAEFTEKDGEWYLLDHASLNGTYINEERLEPQKEKKLEEGDILRFASEEYEYLIITE